MAPARARLGLLAGAATFVAVDTALELEQAIVDWSADTEEEDGPAAPRAVLRRMVLRLGELAVVGARDPAELIAPLVDTLVELRERLTAAGVEVRDTPAGTVWSLTPR